MRWKKLGRIFAPEVQSDWIQSHAMVPIARPLGDYRYRVYFSPRDRHGRSNLSWLDIDIREPTRIRRLSQHPLITPGAIGCFDDNGAMGCWIVEQDSKEMLYYQGWNLGVTVPFYVAVGLAVRPCGDPGRPFDRIGPGPILDRCTDEPIFIADPAVMVDNGNWRMWYQSGRGWLRCSEGMVASYDIRCAESRDGIRWGLTGEQALSFTHPGELAIARFCPVREANGGYRAWYSYKGNEWDYRIGYATSADGISWARHDDAAGIACDPQSWESPMICYPFVFDTEVGRFMLYNGGRYGAAGFGIAVLDQD